MRPKLQKVLKGLTENKKLEWDRKTQERINTYWASRSLNKK
jgi:hypothetical protein